MRIACPDWPKARSAIVTMDDMSLSKWLLLPCVLLSLASHVVAGEVTPSLFETTLQAAAQSVETGDVTTARESLLTLDAPDVPPFVRTQADLLLGILLLRELRFDEAAVRLEAAVSHPLLADYALYHLAQAQRQAGRPDQAAETLGKLVTSHPQSLFLERASREMPRDFLDASQLVQAEESARKYLSAVSANSGRSAVRLTLGEILLRAGRTEEAEEVFRRLWVDVPSTPESQRAKELLSTIPTGRPFTAEEQFQRATTLYHAGRHALAIPELTPFALVGPPRETQVRLMLGISAFNVRQYARAIQWLEPLKDAPTPDRVEALFWLGRSAGRAADTARFTEYLTLVADTAPPSRRSEEALYLLAQSAADDADLDKSRAYLTRLLRDYPKGTWTDVALWLQGWLAYKQHQMKAAATSWERLAADEPASRWRIPALYWRGRALEAGKKPSEAIQAYRTLLDATADQHYYRLRATERLAVLAKDKAAPRQGPQPLSRGVSNGLHAQKARALRVLGLTDEAAEEWSEQVRAHPDERVGLAEACSAFLDLRRYEKAVWVGTRMLRPLFVQAGGKPPIPGYWQCTYPLGHLDLVQRYATERGLDPYLVLALIREESGFAPRAISRTGARGLMQLMPQTADLTAREHKLPPVAPAALETPEVNIPLGVNHLADLLQELNGNVSLSLAAYNAGKQPVQRWLQRFGFTDELEFIEDIPFTETRNYVKRVVGSYERYKSLYGSANAENRTQPSGPGTRRNEKRPTGERLGGATESSRGAKR
jgi:soluble lytic murein transglycosylase